jgi:hypothetical protein
MLSLFAAAALLAGAVLASPPPDTASTAHILRAGTPVTLLLMHELKTRQVKAGQQVQCRVAQAVMVDSCIAIPEGGPAVVEITEARNAGLLGRPDRLVMNAVSATSVTGQPISLHGTFALEGEDRMVESLASSQVICCLFFLVPGDRVVLGEGTGWTAQIAYDNRLPKCQTVAQGHR